MTTNSENPRNNSVIAAAENAPSQASGETLVSLAKRAGPIARNARLDSINLRKLSTELKCSPEDVANGAELQSTHSVEHLFTRLGEERGNHLDVKVHFAVKVSGTTKRKIDLLVLKCTFDVRYWLPGEVPAKVVEDMEAFARTNTMIHVWPYYRELVQSTTWRMGLPPFPLPLFRISDTTNAPRSDVVRDTGKGAKGS